MTVRLPGGTDISSHNAAGSRGLQPLAPHDPHEESGYRLLARIGEGGMGTVYLTHTRGGQPVALKVIRREYAQDEEFRRRFQQEVQAARRVQGYHVVPVVDHNTTGGRPWLATAYVPGLSLDEALTRFGPLPLPAVLQLVGCAAEALRAVHAAGVVHRDLKPSNVLLAANGPWVIDFGIARAADSTQLTRSGSLIGTPQFMSPEHANGLPLAPATDLFSLGLIAAVAATGRHPYGDAGAITLATKIANTAMRPPDLSGYPPALRDLLARCLTADPAARPSPAELAALCERAAGRPLRDFTGWLPEPLATEIVRREAAAQIPPGAPASGRAPAPPSASPSVSASASSAASPPVSRSVSGPTAADPGTAYPAYPGGPPPGQQSARQSARQPAQQSAQQQPPQPAGFGAPPERPLDRSPAGAAHGGRRRTALALGGGALAVILAVALTYTLTRRGTHDTDGTDAKGRNPATGTPAPSTPASVSAPATDDIGDGGSGAPTTEPAGATPTRQPRLLIQDRRFVIRSPAFGAGTHVDLDNAVVEPNAAIGDTEGFEMEYQGWAGSSMRLLTTFGLADGTTYDACRIGVGADALPGELFAEDLKKGRYLAKGSVLCTVTSAGNLAMLKITDVAPAGNQTTDPMPGYSTLLTVWSMPESQQSPLS